ncbi:winged helix-turn-helix domain-containing protein [Chromatiaceae bacterium AAb-1]|nr:winged helix-turn-helix domain-containing protein [Chromatiaceae bacterium AAb-1]
MTKHQSFYLGELLINPAESVIQTTAEAISMQQKPMEVLVFLALQHPRLVSRQELIDAVWAGNGYVGEKALTNAIWQLRNVLQQLSSDELIVTVRKKGYRLSVAPSYTGEPVVEQPEVPVAPPAVISAPAAVAKYLAVVFFMLLIAAAGYITYVLNADNSVAEAEVTTLTKGAGRAMFPALSPDERYLAFSWRKFESASDLYLIDLKDSSRPVKQLTFSADDESRPLWGKDNRHIYYSSKTAIYGECYIMKLDTVTLHSQKLAACNRHSTVYTDISPDGRFLVFNGSINKEGASLYQLDLQNPEASAQPIACKINCQYRARDLAFSPDGKYLAVTRRANRLSEEIYLHNLLTGAETKLTQGEEDVLGLVWHPDGKRLLYSALRHGRRQGYVMNTDTKSTASLELDDFAWPTRISHDGYVYYHTSSNVPQLGYLPLNKGVAGAVFPLTAAEARYEAPHYNKMQHALAYVSNESGYMEIWMADPYMENRRQLTRLYGMVKYPQWSNSGRYIAFVGRFPGEEEDKLMLLEVKTGKLIQLKTGARWHGQLSWWYDDSAVIFSHSNNLFSINVSNGEIQQLTVKGAVWGQMPAADKFYFSKGRNRGLWQLLPDGGEVQLLPGSVFSSRTAWAVAEHGIYFLQQKPGQLLLSYFDTGNGTTSDVILLPSDLLHPLSTMSFDAENARLLFELSMHPRADIQQLKHPLLQ